MSDSKSKKPLIIIDGYGFIFRAYHVQPPLSAPDGTPVGALYGFTSMLIKLISDFKPDHAVMTLDHGGKNFRHELYNEYKANRPPAPDDLRQQLSRVVEVAEALNFTTLSTDGFEADDIIATLALKARANKREVIIISSDKDLMQLVNGHIRMFDPMKSKFIDEDAIIKKFGVGANKVREVQALIGDNSDNIPGVRGIGPKGAAELIGRFDTLDNLLNNIDKISKPKQREQLKECMSDARISYELVGLKTDVPIDEDIENFFWKAPEGSKISAYLNHYGFHSLKKRVERLFDVKIEEAPMKRSKNESNDFKIKQLKNSDDLLKLENEIKRTGHLSIMKTDDGDIELCADRDVYNFKIEQDDNLGDLFSYQQKSNNIVQIRDFIEKVLRDESVKKITYNIKELLRQYSGKVNSCDDLQLMYYVLNAGKKSTNLIDIIKQQFPNIQSDSSFVAYFFRIQQKLQKDIFDNKLLYLYSSIDLETAHILYKMESVGIKLNVEYLNDLSNKFGERVIDLEKKIFFIAGEEFNVASPKQLGDILFDKLKLPFAKVSGKTKAYTTNAEILEKLAVEGYEIAVHLLEHRHLSKLKNTYTDALPKQIKAGEESRVHTTFLQAVTSTGRLSSNNPNIQNIPVRTSEGNQIRAAFIAQDGFKLISADYSQIELRGLSHVADIKELKQAFWEDRDIHIQTASQIFKIGLGEVTSELRRRAKMINYGIIYGISAFGLASRLAISREDASEYIERYFEEFPGIRQYMSRTIEYAKDNGYVENILGRRCYIPSINDSNHALRSFGERAAINAPMQSLAADIVKIAMINVQNMLDRRGFKTKLLLQIHDELIFEAPEDEVEKIMPIIKKIMETSYKIDVDLKVDINCGNNWQEIH